jgi:hypothetical protein
MGARALRGEFETMSRHSELRIAAIVQAARAAGAIDADDIALFIPRKETMAPAEAVAAVKAMRPHLFNPTPAKEMTQAEYHAALVKYGVNPRMIRR